MTTILPGHISRMMSRSSNEIVGSIAESSSSPTVPPVDESDANSSFGVVRKLIHQAGRGIALMMVPGVSCGGIEKPLRLSRRRAPATGVSTVKNRVSKPAAAARRASSYEISRSRITYSWNQLRPLGFAAFTSSIEVVPSVDSVNGMPAAPAAPAPAILALGLHQAGEARRGDAERQRARAAEHLAGRVDHGHVAQDRRVELDVLERLAGARERQLALGGALGVVERRLRRAALRDVAQVGDRQRLLEPAVGRVEGRRLEPHELGELSRVRELALDHGAVLSLVRCREVTRIDLPGAAKVDRVTSGRGRVGSMTSRRSSPRCGRGCGCARPRHPLP